MVTFDCHRILGEKSDVVLVGGHQFCDGLRVGSEEGNDRKAELASVFDARLLRRGDVAQQQGNERFLETVHHRVPLVVAAFVARWLTLE